MNNPIVITDKSFQLAWVGAVTTLIRQNWECFNLIVQIEDISTLDSKFHKIVKNFANDIGVLPPKDVAYTIFPHNLYKLKKTRRELFHAYNKVGGFYDWTRKRPRRNWGTYFRRMTHYKKSDGAIVNQLDKIIHAIKNWNPHRKAAYNLIIPKPGADTAKPLGAPCLTYIAPQVSNSNGASTVNLLAVYRNHDFLERAYGNYWGLCNLTEFIAKESEMAPGRLTCISSHAYVPSNKTSLKNLMSSVL